MKKTTLLFLVTALFSVNMAFADGPPPGGPDGHRGPPNFDTNGDGKVTFEEFKAKHEAQLKEHFDRIDTNHDGVLDKAELEAFKSKMEEFKGRRGDRDGGGPPPGQ